MIHRSPIVKAAANIEAINWQTDFQSIVKRDHQELMSFLCDIRTKYELEKQAREEQNGDAARFVQMISGVCLPELSPGPEVSSICYRC